MPTWLTAKFLLSVLLPSTVGNKLLFEKHFRVERKANLMGLEPSEL